MAWEEEEEESRARRQWWSGWEERGRGKRWLCREDPGSERIDKRGRVRRIRRKEVAGEMVRR